MEYIIYPSDTSINSPFMNHKNTIREIHLHGWSQFKLKMFRNALCAVNDICSYICQIVSFTTIESIDFVVDNMKSCESCRAITSADRLTVHRKRGSFWRIKFEMPHWFVGSLTRREQLTLTECSESSVFCCVDNWHLKKFQWCANWFGRRWIPVMFCKRRHPAFPANGRFCTIYILVNESIKTKPLELRKIMPCNVSNGIRYDD